MEKYCTFFEIGAEFLNIIEINFGCKGIKGT
jgi:hypothetical protein